MGTQKKSKFSIKLMAMLLAAIMAMGVLPTEALASDAPFTLSYKVDGETETKTATAAEIGTMANCGFDYDVNAKVYLVNLPYGATVTAYDNTNASSTTYGSALPDSSELLSQIDGNYVSDGAMIGSSDDCSYKTMLDYTDIGSEAATYLKSEEVTGFAVYSTAFGQEEGCMVIVQISTKAPATETAANTSDSTGLSITEIGQTETLKITNTNALEDARNNTVSDTDICISFSYINNFAALYPALRNTGTDVYKNDALALPKGSTTLYSAMQTTGLTFDEKVVDRLTDSDTIIQDGGVPLLMVYVNGVNYGTMLLDQLAGGTKVVQLHDGDEVKLVRIPMIITKSDASSGYDTTKFSYSTTADLSECADSVAMISFDSLPQGIKVGDKAVFKASVTGSYDTNLGKALSAENLSLFVSGPSETKEYSQSPLKTMALTDAGGQLSYVFTEPGWYTVAMLNSQKEVYTFTNALREKTYGSYSTVYAGDFALIYVDAADDESALISAQKEANLNTAKDYYNQYHDYDFEGTGYETFTEKYNTLKANQNAASSFKGLVDSFNTDYEAMSAFAAQNAMDHEAIITGIRDLLKYIPNDPSSMDYTYKNILNTIQTRYNSLNSYQKNLFSKAELSRLDVLAAIDVATLFTPANIAIDVQKDVGLSLPTTNGNLTSAPNENRVYVINPDGNKTQSYYTWKTSDEDMEPSDEDMTAYPGNEITVRRVITQTDDQYWLVYSIDNGVTWELMTLEDGGANKPMVMLKAEFILPDMERTSCALMYKAVPKSVYEEMKLGAVDPGLSLDEAKTTYKAALVEVFNSYEQARYEEGDYLNIRDAENNGLDNIEKAGTAALAQKALNAAIAAMKAVPQKSQVHVIVRNDTWSAEDGAPWAGVLIDTWVPIDNDSTMMNCVKAALESNDYSGVGFDADYISAIHGIGEFNGGTGSGWMGTINDWFTNEGFSQFTVANGKLAAGDLISIEYTCKLGADIRGGVDGNTDTSLYKLELSNGTLTPVFDGGTTDYLLTLDSGVHSTTLEFSANNRSFQARGYKNVYTPSAAEWIATGDTVTVQSGDILYIGVGEQSWASMGKSEPTVYTVAVVNDNGAADSLIKALPAAAALTYADKPAVDRANAVYQSLSEEKKAEVPADLRDKLTACIARIKLLEDAEAVKKAIQALPNSADITIAHQSTVEQVKAKFNALGSEGQAEIPIGLVKKLEDCIAKQEEYITKLEEAAAILKVDEILNATKSYLSGLGTPGVGSVGGEWMVIGMLRAGADVSDAFVNGYYSAAINYINNKINDKGQLHSVKSTDNARLILALTALGKDVTNIGGKNLLTALSDLDYLKKQGINGPIWALIALDCHGYSIPTLKGSGTQTTRDNLVSTILAAQLADGGWALSGNSADADMTAMALQSIAPYYSYNAGVIAAVDKAIAKLSAMQQTTGGYGSWGTTNSESCAQVIVALTALGINPDKDSRFVKDGKSVVDALLTYYVDGGGFKHILSSERDGMATEQGFYSIVAYKRFLTGQNSLYDMTDATIFTYTQTKDVSALIDAIGTVTVDSGIAIYTARNAYDALSAEDKVKVTNYKKLTDAETAYAAIAKKIDDAKMAIDNIGTVTYNASSKEKIDAARSAYDQLSDKEKSYVTNYSILVAAEKLYEQLKNAEEVIDLINAIGDVTGDSGNAIKAAREAYIKLTTEEMALVTNYSILTAAERKFESLDLDLDLGGSTKVIGDGDTKDVIDGVTYMVSAEAATLMEGISKLSKAENPDKQEIIDAYKAYIAMTDKQKAEVFNYDDLEALTNVLGLENHKDTDSGIEAEGIDWHIELVVEEKADGDVYDIVSGSIGSNTLIKLLNISFNNLLTGEEFHPTSTVKIKLAGMDLSGYDQIRIAHYTDNGRIEYYDCKIENGYVIWESNNFSYYGVIGGIGEAIKELNDETDAIAISTTSIAATGAKAGDSLLWLWIVLGCVGVAALAVVLVLMRIRKKVANDDVI